MGLWWMLLWACSPKVDGDTGAAPEDTGPAVVDTEEPGETEDTADTGDTVLPGVDGDGDGWTAAEDCDDGDPGVNPAAPELFCDGVDNDCNGTVDGVAFFTDDGLWMDYTLWMSSPASLASPQLLARDGTLRVCAGTWYAALEIRGDVDVVGEGPDVSFLSGGGVTTVLATEGADLTLRGVTVREGRADRVYGVDTGTSGLDDVQLGGGIVCVDGALSAEDAVIEDNVAEAGGGLFAWGCDVSLVDVDVRRNVAEVWAGAGLFVADADADVVRGTWSDNVAVGYGGAARITRGKVTAEDTDIVDNVAAGGGAFLVWLDGEVELFGGRVEGNQGATGGGAVDHYGVAFTARDTVFASNASTSFSGGAISAWEYVTPPLVALYDVEMVDNTAYDGAAVEVVYGELIVEGGRFVSNVASGSVALGGAVSLLYADAALSDVEFTDNRADGYAGGALYQSEGVLTCADCVFRGNSAWLGGALYANTSTMQLTDAVFEDNAAGAIGGAISAWDRSALDLVGGRFFGNTGPTGGAIEASDLSAVYAEGVVFDDNAADVGGAVALADGAWLDAVVSSFLGNQAEVRGGAIAVDAASAEGEACDFADNTPDDAATAGQGYVWGPGTSFTCDGGGCTASAGPPR